MRKLETEGATGEVLKVGARRILETRTLDDQAWDDGAGGREAWSVERAICLWQQARNARTETEWNAALLAADRYDDELYFLCLRMFSRWCFHPNNMDGLSYTGTFWTVRQDAGFLDRYRIFWHRIPEGTDVGDIHAAIVAAEREFGWRVFTENKWLAFDVDYEGYEPTVVDMSAFVHPIYRERIVFEDKLGQ